MKLAAFLASLDVFRISRRSILAGLVVLSFQTSLLRSLNIGHAKRTYRTVWLPCPHSQSALVISGTFHWKKNHLSPIFSVYICTIIELRGFGSIVWSCRMLCLGLGVSKRVVRPVGPVSHFWAHCSCISWYNFVFAADPRFLRYFGFGTVLSELTSINLPLLPRTCFHPVASFASLSASSFPSIPW